MFIISKKSICDENFLFDLFSINSFWNIQILFLVNQINKILFLYSKNGYIKKIDYV